MILWGKDFTKLMAEWQKSYWQTVSTVKQIGKHNVYIDMFYVYVQSHMNPFVEFSGI